MKQLMKKILFILSCLLSFQLANAQKTSVNEQDETHQQCADLAKGVSYYKNRLVRNSEAQTSPIVLNNKEVYQLMDCYDSRLASRYKHYYHMRNIGRILTFGGAACFVGGFATMVSGIRLSDEDASQNGTCEGDDGGRIDVGAFIMLGSIAMIDAGIPLMIVGKHKQKTKVKEFSVLYLYGTADEEQKAPCYISLNSSKKGLGLSLTF